MNMLDSQASTIAESNQSTPDLDEHLASLDLRNLPKLFVLPTHLSDAELAGVLNELKPTGAAVASEVAEASIVLCELTSSRRVRFELQTRQCDIQSIYTPQEASKSHAASHHASALDGSLGKRKRDSSPLASLADLSFVHSSEELNEPFQSQEGQMKIVKLDWLHDSLDQGQPLPLNDHLICVVTLAASSRPPSSPVQEHGSTQLQGQERASSPPTAQSNNIDLHKGQTSTDPRRRGRNPRRRASPSSKPALVRETTEEHDAHAHRKLPEMPEWVREEHIYACQRVTPPKSPNDAFIELLKQIRLSRVLIEDEIGVRAYSTSIASVAAYPYALSGSQEVMALPGCDQKIAQLFREFQATGGIATADAVDSDPALRVIHSFYNIWGVGARTAREFYYERGWRDHDDVIEYGWNALTRVQQIGLKFFDEFELKIPRAEVAAIAEAVARHARELTDGALTCTVVGGYRRGKAESGDVDLVLSHPDQDATLYLVQRLVARLEDAEMVSHTLTLGETNSARGQQPVGLKMGAARGSGFDTLDKALVVWQDPNWPARDQDRTADPDAPNPNVHRRVDIIVSPWRTVGCAVAGWSSGATFQRDLRRWCRHKLRWKFDSSGVRDLATGRWVDLEHWSDEERRAKTPEEAERRVFEGLGLTYREPSDRCTG